MEKEGLYLRPLLKISYKNWVYGLLFLIMLLTMWGWVYVMGYGFLLYITGDLKSIWCVMASVRASFSGNGWKQFVGWAPVPNKGLDLYNPSACWEVWCKGAHKHLNGSWCWPELMLQEWLVNNNRTLSNRICSQQHPWRVHGWDWQWRFSICHPDASKATLFGISKPCTVLENPF